MTDELFLLPKKLIISELISYLYSLISGKKELFSNFRKKNYSLVSNHLSCG